MDLDCLRRRRSFWSSIRVIIRKVVGLKEESKKKKSGGDWNKKNEGSVDRKGKE